MNKIASYTLRGLAFAAVLAVSGCEWEDDPTDHDVPAGKGLIVVDNNSVDNITVYIDGTRRGSTDAFNNEAYSVEPGVHRVILDQRSGSRSWRDDVDAVEGKRTILGVTINAGDSEYDVHVYFD